MIRLYCDCGRQIAAPDQWLGKRVKCPQCGRPVRVRKLDQAAEAPLERSEPIAESVVDAASDRSTTLGDSSETVAVTTTMEVASAPSPAPVPEEIPSTPNGEAFDSLAREPQAPAAIEAPAAEPESAPAPGTESPPAPRPAPRRPLAPAPPINAVLHISIPEEDDDREYDPRRLPRFLGALALLVGLASAAAYWIPACKPWAIPAAGGGLTLAAIGFSLAMSRHRLGYWIPLLALIVSGATLSLPWVLTGRAPVGSSRLASQSDDPGDRPDKSVQVLKVTSLRIVGKDDGPTVDLAFELTNKSGKAIKAIDGTLEIKSKDGQWLDDPLGLPVPSLAPNASYKGTNTWQLKPRTRAALGDKTRFTAQYRAKTVFYADGNEETFGQ